ncbi:hypothetical protein AMS68_004632 [Peltaster fructicola]|uniref:Uncharacterized protein n=1 Tax=Peltaster fructicola TaxID=286661 RepID=A0A6H0XWS9_9PEZI|nr:hypothetical protein AMS68_004632 [Peltaster fructicola]
MHVVHQHVTIKSSQCRPTGLPAIRACLFDMDGLLIDSEDFYTLCTNIVLAEYGRPNIPWNIKAQLQGRPGPQAGQIFHEWAQLPISREEFMSKIQVLQKEHFPKTKPLLASHEANFKLKTDHQQELFTVFTPEHRVLGDDKRIAPGRGKPAPDIYLLALETINARLRQEKRKEILPEECLVFEDSVPGVEAGRRAGMQAVWCPHEGLLKEYAGREETVLAGLMGEHKENEEKNEEIGTVKHDGKGRKKGAPGEVGDGWGVLLKTLVDFPYERYGIKVQDSNRL